MKTCMGYILQSSSTMGIAHFGKLSSRNTSIGRYTLYNTIIMYVKLYYM